MAVHFYKSKVKYDLDIWTGEDVNERTRIYNVDSCFVVPYE